MARPALVAVYLATLCLTTFAYADWNKPWFCHNLDCPQYSVVKSADAYELREYESGVWVSTVVEDYTYRVAVGKGFMRLFRYISGNNEDGTHIDMTAPVRVRAAPGDGPYCTNNFTVSFFVPPSLQDNPPKPSDSNVFIDAAPRMRVFVANFSGWDTEARTLRHVRDLADTLDDADERYDDSHFYFAGYDSPFRLFNRHNEVLLEAGDEAADDGVAVASIGTS